MIETDSKECKYAIKPLKKPNRKKIKIAKLTYDTYCKAGNLADTAAITGLAINTIRKYIALIEDIDNRNKISSKQRYYDGSLSAEGNSAPDHKSSADTVSNTRDPIYNNIYNNNIYSKDINNKDININNNSNKNIDIKDNNTSSINNNSDEEINNNNKGNSVSKKDKASILIKKIDDISLKYLDYLDNPDSKLINKTSLKDRAIIAAVLLDKKILLEHKNADVVKNQSVIFNLFASNKNLAEFITNSLGRQKALQARPVNKYIPG